MSCTRVSEPDSESQLRGCQFQAGPLELCRLFVCLWVCVLPYSFSVTYEPKWMVTQALPLILMSAVVIVFILTRVLQFVQRKVFKVVPFGAAGDLNLVDVCIGVLITGSYYLYFCTSARGESWGLRCCLGLHVWLT